VNGNDAGVPLKISRALEVRPNFAEVERTSALFIDNSQGRAEPFHIFPQQG